MNEVRYAYASEGNAQFLRAVADSLAETLDEYCSSNGWRVDADNFRQVAHLPDEGLPNALSWNELAGVFTIFVGSWFSTKLFDEVYSRTAKRPIGKFLDRLLSRTHGRSVEIRDSIYLADIDTLIVIRAVVKPGEVKSVASLILQAHRVAHGYIAANGRQAQVHCHTIEAGRVDIVPKLFASFDEITRFGRNLDISKGD